MNTNRFYMCAIPAPFWKGAVETFDFTHLVSDALSGERRIAKEVNLGDEYSRYNLICLRLEQEVMQSGRIRSFSSEVEFQQLVQSGLFPFQTYSSSYLHLLSRLGDQPGSERLGATFFPPDLMYKHRSAFELWADQQGLIKTPLVKQRLQFLDWAISSACGLVELQCAFLPAETSTENLDIYRRSSSLKKQQSKSIEIPDFEVSELDLEFFGKKGKKQRLFLNLVDQIRGALRTGEPVSFGNQAPHDVITEALFHFVYCQTGISESPTKLRIAYSDGSEAKPFPVFCLSLEEKETEQKKSVRPLRMALMSMRHFELDALIDMCWFRNREVSRSRSLGETDEFCYQLTLKQLDESLRHDSLWVELYHTGFEPAVIGFYRGLVQTLLNQQDKANKHSLHVVPFYYRGGMNYQQGSSWR
jgi:hypothetical protein